MSSTSGIQEIAPRQAAEWLKSGECVLIDVREADEHARERIEGSRLLPLSKFDPAAAKGQVSAGQKLLVHCKGGRRSMNAARICASVDPSMTVYSVAGGLDAWKREGLGVIEDRRRAPISVMRQVQIIVGVLLLIGSALAWFVHTGFIAIPALLGAGLTVAGTTGTCGLALLVERMPWNRAPASAGTCGV